MKKATKSDFIKFLKDLSDSYEVIAPQEIADEGIDLSPVTDFDKITFDYVNTERSFKRFIFPQSQELFKFENNKIVSEEIKPKKQVIVGIRNCDINNFKVLDYNFIEKDPVDNLYKDARDNSIFIVGACIKNNSTCFCKTFKIDPLGVESGDLSYLFDDKSEEFYIKANTEKGTELIKKLNCKEASDFDEKVKKYKTNHDNIPDLIEDKDLVEIFSGQLDDDKWNTIFQGCVNCGICTFYCPTCYCFDIEEEGKFWKGRRVRNWDSCMFSIYSKETTGHNPRPTNRERYRNRVLHKFYYQLKHNESYGCVGCGRCISNCPTNIDIRKIIKTFI